MSSRRQILFQLLGLVGWARARLLAASPPPSVQKQSFSVPLVDDQGQIISRYDASARHFIEDLGGGVTLDMACIPGGTFAMGSVSNVSVNTVNPAEQPVHQVSVPSVALGVFAVTRGQWRRVSSFPQVAQALSPIPPISSETEDLLPIDLVFEGEAEEFCRRLQAYTGR